jgi:hypothetical protein
LKTCKASATGRVVAVAACVLLIARTAGAEEWRLTYAYSEQKQTDSPKGDAPPKHEVRAFPVTIILGSQYLIAKGDRQETVYDFRSRRIIRLNLVNNLYSDRSLYSDIGFRVSELVNRMGIDAALKATKLGVQGRFDNESCLSLEMPPGFRQTEPDPVIERTKLGATGWEFCHDGHAAVEFVPAIAQIPGLFYRRFGGFLRHECCIHPEIIREITASGQIPQRLVVRWHYWTVSTTSSFELTSVAYAEKDSTVLPTDATPETPSGALGRVLALVRDEGRSTHRPTRSEAGQFADQAIAEKKYLDAGLALIEYGLQSGEQPADEMRAHSKEFQGDESWRRYLASFDQSTKEACQNSLKVNGTLDRTKLKKGYMLDLQRADLLMQVGHAKEAEELFLHVLEANPFLTGVYHDLGQLYCKEFEQSTAWVCFDTGRMLYPSHPIMRDIDALEQRLRHDFPEYF